eukprot:TRINITY_DN13262_c0_g1_i4.p1 TRINITY_DN13262_c0_g1~~TRINITY_DN13262_c0_g1_i4.p1  ORF type:complete len:257 (+),score=45.92 TRINITY_DN13262_c0_g1_i4:104-874(+)
MKAERNPEFIPEILQREGSKLLAVGNYKAAIEKMAKALAIARSSGLNRFDYFLAKYYYSYGNALLAYCLHMKKFHSTADFSDQMEEDRRVAQENLELSRMRCERRLSEKIGEAENRDCLELLAQICLGLGKALAMEGKGEEAVVEYNKVLNIRKRIFRHDSRQLAETYYTIASEIATANGKKADVLSTLLESAKILEDCFTKAVGNYEESVSEEGKIFIRAKRELAIPDKSDTSEIRDLRSFLGKIYDRVSLLCAS